mgnify:CR=1 FL=1
MRHITQQENTFLLSTAHTAMLLQMYHKPFEFSFMLFPDTIILTILFFCICFATVGLSQVRTIRKIKIIDMLNAERKNDILGTPHKWIYKLFPVNFVLYLLITFYNIRTLSYYFNGEFELVIAICAAPNAVCKVNAVATFSSKPKFLPARIILSIK